MYAISSYYDNALMIQINVHSNRKEVGRGVPKQMTLYDYVFVVVDINHL